MSSEIETVEWFELVEYFDETGSPERRAAVARWIAATPEREALVAQFRTLWEARRVPRTVAYDEAALAARVMAAVRTPGRQPETRDAARQRNAQQIVVPPGARSSARSIRWTRRLLPSIVGIGALAATAVVLVRSVRAPMTPARQYQTGVMQRAIVRLADGSRVTLAPQTTLTVAPGFGGETRTLSLRGEAYFDVASGSRAPFIVSAGHVRARVLGTAFDVRSYPDEHDVRLAVVSGRISVSAPRTDRGTSARAHAHAHAHAPVQPLSLVLAQGMVGHIGDSTATVVQETAEEAQAYARWTDGKLVFHEAPVTEILAAIGQWYGYDFRVADSSVVRGRLTVTIDSQSTESIMAVLRTMLNVSMTFDGKDGRIVTLHPRRPSPARSERTPLDRAAWSQPTEVGK
jgi:ferric-dicitrate binding protein FerR (iron transport regulator)